MQQLFARLLPFLILGVVLVMVFFALVVFSSLLFWGAVIGAILFLVAVIKNYFFPVKKAATRSQFQRYHGRQQKQESSVGRIIDHDEQDK